jgi:Flp pilus assembly pilin Flp
VRYLQGEDGASAAEYALILSIIGAATALSFVFLGGSIAVAVDKAANCMANHGGC